MSRAIASIASLLGPLWVVIALAGCRGDAVKCDKGCRNYASLMYRKNVETRVAQAPAAERDALRKQLLDELDAELKKGIEQCVTQCQSANNINDTECMIAAKTADQALACFK